tara:strand:+ start:528 stop:1442 length:915 start_codon:yes stop_codon:yes gene_type:complete
MARYQPKSKYNVKEAGPGEFIVKKTRKPYFGLYIETSGGRFYAGNDPKRLLSEIVRPVSLPNTFGRTRDIFKYNVLNKNIFGKLKKVKDIVSTKNIPTEEDYEKGRYTRFFLKRVNEMFGYIEVDQETFKAVAFEDDTVNHHLYETGKITWSLVGNVKVTNEAQIFLQREKFPNLNILFSKLDEFRKTEDRLIENLSTEGGELYYEDGREYKGPYHIHPGNGPMVGAVHIEGFHEVLYYEKQEGVSSATGIAIGSKVPTLTEIAPNYNISETPADTQTSTTPTIVPEPVSAPTTTPSIGGGGGY